MKLINGEREVGALQKGSDSPEFMTTRELARSQGVTMQTVTNLRRRRAIPYYQIGATVRFNQDDIHLVLESSRVESLSELDALPRKD